VEAIELAGARVLITGASRGIGEATARELARRGAQLALSARGEADLARIADAIKAEGRQRPTVVAADLSKEAQVKAMVGAADKAMGGIDVLVNNAGLGLTSPIAEIDPAVLRYVYEVNLMAPLVAAQAVLPGMLQRHRGHIVNVGSVASHISSPNLGGYSSTKFALKAISDALRMELQGTGVGVSLVCPGPIATEFVVNSAGDNEGRLPTRPLGAPASDVARCIARAITRNQAEAFVPAYYQALVGGNAVVPQVMRIAGKRGMRVATKFADRFL
jgi:short-subunit dehydrogenase